jgi:hypothetical protein
VIALGTTARGVQLRIAGTRGAVTERRDREAVAADEMLAVGTAARPCGLAFDVAERLSYRFVMCRADDGGEGAVADAVDDRNRLRGREGQVQNADSTISPADDARLRERAKSIRAQVGAQRPRAFARRRPRQTDRRPLRAPIACRIRDAGRMRRDLPEQIGLIGQRAEIGDALAAIDQHRRQIDQHSTNPG